MKLESYLEEVTENCLEVHRDLKKQNKLKDQSHYKTNLDLLGLNVPAMRNVSKAGFSFSELNPHRQFRIRDYIWKESNIFEVKSQALVFAQKMEAEDLKTNWGKYKNWVNHLDNWAHSDIFSSDVSKLLEKYPSDIYPQFEKWNSSKNPWCRRQSVVGLLYYTQSRKRIPPMSKMFPLVQHLVLDEDYYVQKGLGWTLREIGNIDQKKMINFVRKNLDDLSSVAFTTALEKTDKETKSELKKERAVRRKKQ